MSFLKIGIAAGRLSLICLCTVLLFSTTTAAQQKSYTPAQNRNAAYQIKALLPPAPDDWRAGRARTDWRSDGVSARRSYRPKSGAGRINLIIETRTRGLNYKKDLLGRAAKARDRGYTIKKIGENLALIRHTPFRGELRMWVDGRFLVFLDADTSANIICRFFHSSSWHSCKFIC